VRRAALVLAPALFVAILLSPMPGLEPRAHRLAAVMAAVVVLWVTEALPMPVTALLGVAACVPLEIAPAKEAFAPFADPIMFLFIGSFILARAVFIHGLDRRFAFTVLSLRWVGARPSRILLAYGAVTAFISAWISNTATTAMMFPIGLSILAFLLEGNRTAGAPIDRRYATGMMLMTSFAASIGGLATPIGTPPNLIGMGFIRKELGVELPFLDWTLIGAPVVLCLFIILFFYLNFFCRAGVKEIQGSAEMLRREMEQLGPLTTGQRSALAAFLITATLWIVPGVIAVAWGEGSAAYQTWMRCLPEGVVAILGAVLLFLLPGGGGRRAMTWDEAVKIDWGVVLLYGGGFALGTLSSQTGLASALGREITRVLPVTQGFGLLVVSTVIAAIVSEVTSNTASARAGARRDDGIEPRLHAPCIDALQRDRVRLRPRAPYAHDALRRAPRRRRSCRGRYPGAGPRPHHPLKARAALRRAPSSPPRTERPEQGAAYPPSVFLKSSSGPKPHWKPLALPGSLG
jgi:solute carrier family 13 (sodium-dependent dicarboxylate transporter), member 2/3/5